MSPRAEESLLACLLRLPRLLPGEQRVSLRHEAGDARLGTVDEVRAYEVKDGVGVGVGRAPGCGGRLQG